MEYVDALVSSSSPKLEAWSVWYLLLLAWQCIVREVLHPTLPPHRTPSRNSRREPDLPSLALTKTTYSRKYFTLWTRSYIPCAWWLNQTFSVLLALCEGINWSLVNFPHKEPVTRSFYIFHLHLNKHLSKLWIRRWVETPLRSLWRQCIDRWYVAEHWGADCKMSQPPWQSPSVWGPWVQWFWLYFVLNTFRPTQNGCYYTSKCIFLNESVWIWIQISVKLGPKCSIANIPALAQKMAKRRPGDNLFYTRKPYFTTIRCPCNSR